MLPADFIRKRKPLLGHEWDAFLDSYQSSRSYGLRLNLLKEPDSLPFDTEQIPWAPEGYYVNPEEHPGRHPLHEAGAYYIQEPSAMSVVSLLDPEPGEAVCDLCAAPGGKSTQIAGRLRGEGLLVSNEIVPGRAKTLSQNIERMGIANAVVSNEAPDRMAALFPMYFDRIVVDAPCSGEGMFRKDNKAMDEWSAENITLCSKRQQMILDCADGMLKPGGIMVYSTCTFAPEENEGMVAWFLATHPDYVLEDWKDTRLGEYVSQYPDYAGLCDGKPECVDWDLLSASVPDSKTPSCLEQMLSPALSGTLRLWPHRLKGEGHFAARLRKAGKPVPKKKAVPDRKKQGRPRFSQAASGYEDFKTGFLSPETEPGHGRYELFGRELYLVPDRMPPLTGIKVLRPGLHLGSSLKNRFEPSYALAKALSKNQARQCHDCSDEEAVRYLKGETIPCSGSLKGWTLVCYHNCPLGWGKAQNGILKNHFPKGLRSLSVSASP